MFDIFLNIRLKAIKNTALILNSNAFDGPYSLSQIEGARKNREINQKWFIENFYKMKKKFSEEDFEQLGKDLGFGFRDLLEIERHLNNQ